jgi:lipid-binding SYLF domain-containing protein
MTNRLRRLGALSILTVAMQLAAPAAPARAASAAEIDQAVSAALRSLYASSPAARSLGKKARGILVFPNIVKAGFVFGGQIGDGALRKGGRTAGYYKTTGASYGLQAGIQKYGYALFFMTNDSLAYLDQSQGFEIGSAPSLVILDQGMAGSLNTNTLRKDIYGFVFDQTGLMGGLSFQGTKVTRFHPR